MLNVGAARQIRTADLILTKKPSCFLVSTYSCHGIPPNPLRYKGFGVFHCSSHVICFFLILGHFSLFVGRFVGTLLASPTIFFIFYTLLDSSLCPLARQEMLAKGCKYRFFRSNCTATVSRFFLFRVCGEQMTETATKTATGYKKNAGNRPGVAL